MVALLAARLLVGSTISVRLPPAELTVVDASAAAASGTRVTSGAAACAGARVANNAAAPVVTRASAAAANRARLIGTFRQERPTPASAYVVEQSGLCTVLGQRSVRIIHSRPHTTLTVPVDLRPCSATRRRSAGTAGITSRPRRAGRSAGGAGAAGADPAGSSSCSARIA